MTQEQSAQRNVRTLPLDRAHRALGARFISFGDWNVPAFYSSILEEHAAVRERAGLFDISHMGQIQVTGDGALGDIDNWITNSAAKLTDGKALYSPMCNDDGGVLDDVIVYRVSNTFFMIVVNAGNVDRDYAWMKSHSSSATTVENLTSAYAMLALQGPKAIAIASRVLDGRVATLARFAFMFNDKGDRPRWILRTGYTGEDGCEIMVKISEAAALWEQLLREGAGEGICPAGFGARDTLRLEACYRLHGHDMDTSTTPLEAGLGWAVDLSKDRFIGRETLLRQKSSGLTRMLRGFAMDGRPVARAGYEIYAGGRKIGHVTSGSFAPTLKQSIGLGYVERSFAKPGTAIQIKIRSEMYGARIASIPFYKKEFPT